MKLYAIHYKGELSNNEWSIVTIHKSYETAYETMKQYIHNHKGFDVMPEYDIYTIDTDVDSDVVYDCEYINSDYD